MAIRDPRRFKGKSGGGGLGILGMIAGNARSSSGQNQPVSKDIQPPEYSGPPQFYSNAPSNYGEVTTQPAFDTRNWAQRIMGYPNTAEEINTRTLLGELEGERGNRLGLEALKQKAAFEDTRFPTTLAQRGQELQQTQDIERKGALDKANTLAALQSVEAPVLSNIATMGDLPYNLALEPEQGEALINQARAAKQPYVPVNKAGLQGNLDYAENLSQQQARTFAQELANRPESRVVGSSLLTIDPKTGKPTYEGSADQGYMSEPSIKYDAKGNAVGVNFGQRVPASWNPARQRVGNIYGGGTGSPVSQNIIPSYLRDDNRGVGASQERHEYVTAPGRDGGKPSVITAQGEPPKVEPSELERYEGWIPDLGRAFKAITKEGVEDIGGKVKTVVDPVAEWLDKVRKSLIRKEPVKK